MKGHFCTCESDAPGAVLWGGAVAKLGILWSSHSKTFRKNSSFVLKVVVGEWIIIWSKELSHPCFTSTRTLILTDPMLFQFVSSHQKKKRYDGWCLSDAVWTSFLILVFLINHVHPSSFWRVSKSSANTNIYALSIAICISFNSAQKYPLFLDVPALKSKD